jgi:diaminohydroxyphosphoribosylaminopyrimidine deaminase/5-amino-6-(5-phosphoribosylamino)uracil reductase
MNYMAQALSLARLALGQVSPNPAVGAVVVKNDTIIGQGYTQSPGGDHAEIVALKESGAKAKGSTLYVTLEPCAHKGRTPPCVDSIVTAGVAEVYMATLDDNPLVAGEGRKALEKAGLKVSIGDRENEARQLNEAYFKFIKSGIPFVTAKYAMSLDGKIATREGDSHWISGEESRHIVHQMRHISDAVMVGINTVLADNPRLTSRLGHGQGGVCHCQPMRVVVDSEGNLPRDAAMLGEPGRTLLVLGKNIKAKDKATYEKAGAEIVVIPGKGDMVDLKGLLEYLGKRKITSLMVEGGGSLLGSLFDESLVDKVICFITPLLIGGSKARVPVGGEGVTTMAEALRLHRTDISLIGEDVMVVGYVKE